MALLKNFYRTLLSVVAFSHGAPRRFATAVLVSCSLVLLCLPTRAQNSLTEYRVKAVFLFNFAQFVDWPASAFASPDAPFTIGVLGKDPFGSVLDETVQNEEVKGRKLRVERYRNLREIGNCQILFISRSEATHLDKIGQELKGKPILTVGEFEGFTLRGGMIRFINENQKIRLRINVDAVSAADLTISSRLLRLAEIVHNGETK